MSFTVLMKDATVFKNLFKAMSLLDEPVLRVSKESMILRQMDVAHVVLIDLEIPATVFEDYNCGKDDMLMVSRKEVEDSLTRAKVDQSIGIAVDENKLAIMLIGKSEKTFFIPLLNVPEKEMKLLKEPEKELFKSSVKLDVDAFKDDIDDMFSVLGKEGQIEVKLTPDTFSLKGVGTTRSLNIVLKNSILAIDCKEEQTAHYGTVYMKEVIDGGAGLSGVVNLSFGTEFPAKFDFELPFKGRLVYYIAPRIEPEG